MPRQSRSREVLSPDLVIIATADLPADLVRTAERGRAGDRRGSIDRSIDRDDRTPRKQRAAERITESTGRASLDSRSVLLARTGESTTWEYTSPRITPPLRLARNIHIHIHAHGDAQLAGRACARKQRVSIHFSPVRDLVSPGITAAFYPCAHHVTEAAITNLEARPSRAKSLGFAARRGRPLSHVICMKRDRAGRNARERARGTLLSSTEGKRRERRKDRGPKGRR